jgi:hypothetical protein
MRALQAAVLAVLAALVAAGCGESYAAIETVHPPLGHRKVETSQAAFQMAKGAIMEIVSARQWTLAGGEAVPDYEYLYISVPQRSGTYRPGEAGVALYRLVRVEREQFLYKAVGGTIKVGFGFLSAGRMRAKFDVETVLAPQGGFPADKPIDPGARRYRLTGTVKAAENLELAQGLVNKYQDDVKRLESPPPPPEVKPKKSKQAENEPAAPTK